MRNPNSSINRQSGAVLVISLIMLLLLTMIGVSSSQNAGMEERMAGNSRDKNLAFQAAESALNDAENYLNGVKNGTILPAPTYTSAGTNGFYSNTPAGDIASDSFWSGNANTITYSGDLNGIDSSSPPRYIIQDLGLFLSGTQHNYRITAYGTGGTTAAVAIVQSIFRI